MSSDQTQISKPELRNSGSGIQRQKTAAMADYVQENNGGSSQPPREIQPGWYWAHQPQGPCSTPRVIEAFRPSWADKDEMFVNDGGKVLTLDYFANVLAYELAGPIKPGSDYGAVDLLQDRIHAFQVARFPAQTIQGKLNHLVLEAKEAAVAPDDISEQADCLILLLGINAMSGRTMDDLVKAAHAKMDVNSRRQWNGPNAIGVYTHKEEVA